MNRYLKPGGYFITSGIIRERKQEVIEAYQGQGYSIETIIEMGEGWRYRLNAKILCKT
jgi:ribosomal protein L11 methyltransferase